MEIISQKLQSMQFHNYHRSNRVCSKETEGTRMKTVPEVTITEQKQ